MTKQTKHTTDKTAHKETAKTASGGGRRAAADLAGAEAGASAAGER